MAALVVAPAAGVADSRPAPRSALAIDTEPAEARWRIRTPHGVVRVWTPRGYHAPTAATVVYVHGYYLGVDRAWREHALRDQFGASRLHAMFIACSGPEDSAEPVSWRSLRGLLDAVERETGVAVPRGHVIAVAHGGGGRALVPWLDERSLSTVVLIDASHVNTAPHYRWARGGVDRRLLEVAERSHWRSHMVGRLLPTALVVDGFPLPSAARDARIVYVRTVRDHTELITDADTLPAVLRALRVPLVPGARGG